MSVFGIEIDLEKNGVRSPLPHTIHGASSRIQVWVVPTNEELQIAIETCQVLKDSGCKT